MRLNIQIKRRASRLAGQLRGRPASKETAKQDYYPDSGHRTYSCLHCRAHLASHDELISKLFHGNHGKAYLFNRVLNVGVRQAVQRELITGLHAVADIYCLGCQTTVGWKYEQAFVPSQRYKEGKFIIEMCHLLKENNWEPTSYNASHLLLEERQQRANRELALEAERQQQAKQRLMGHRSRSLDACGGGGQSSSSTLGKPAARELRLSAAYAKLSEEPVKLNSRPLIAAADEKLEGHQRDEFVIAIFHSSEQVKPSDQQPARRAEPEVAPAQQQQERLSLASLRINGHDATATKTTTTAAATTATTIDNQLEFVGG